MMDRTELLEVQYLRILKKRDKEIERLREEKEWLLNELIDMKWTYHKMCNKTEYRKLLQEAMQQSLKEG